MLLKFADAARLANVDPATISRSVKSGVISVTLDERGKRRIDFSELCRVYPHVKTSDLKSNATESRDAAMQHENDLLKIQISSLKSLIENKDEYTNALKERIQMLQDHLDWLKVQLEQANSSRKSLEEKLIALPFSGSSLPSRDSKGRFIREQK